MMRRLSAVSALAVAGVLASGAAATAATPNHEATKAPKTILNDAKKALLSVKSVRIRATAIDDGKKLTFTYLYSKSATCIQFAEGAAKVQLITIGKAVYINGNAAFYKTSGGGDNSAAAGLWIKVASSNAAAEGLAGLFSMKEIAGSITQPDGTVTVAPGVKSVNGHSAFGVVDHGSDGGTYYFSTTGKPLPLELVSTKKADGVVTFDEYNANLKIKAPKVDVDETTTPS